MEDAPHVKSVLGGAQEEANEGRRTKTPEGVVRHVRLRRVVPRNSPVVVLAWRDISVWNTSLGVRVASMYPVCTPYVLRLFDFAMMIHTLGWRTTVLPLSMRMYET